MRRRRGGRWRVLAALAALAVLVWWQLGQAPDDSARGARADAPGSADAPRSADAPGGPEAAGAVDAGWVVTQVVDGDTVEVSRDGVVERVRLLGIDTPERDQCGYDEATALVTDLVTGREVSLVVGSSDDRDRYDRLLRFVEVTVDGAVVDAGLRQLEAGLAAEVYDSRTGYPRHDREDAYVAADEAAPDVCPDLREH